MVRKKTNKKRTLIILLAVLVLCVSMLSGCGNDDQGETKQPQEQTQENTQNQEQKQKNEEAENADSTKGGKDSSSKNNRDKGKDGKDKTGKSKDKKNGKSDSKGQNHQQTKKEEKAKNGSSKKENSSKSKDSKAKQKSKKAKSKKKSANQSQKNKKGYCHMTIECKVLIGREDIDPGTKSLIPKSGYILKNKKIEVKNGDTVYSVLNRAKGKYNLTVSVENTQFGKYIQGISGIEEKACGDESGWKYKINGKYPSKSCSKITVNKGDKIVWKYVLKA